VAEADEGEEVERPEYRTAAGRVVYGGGGVTPDVVIEPVRIPDVVVDLERREEFFEFAIDYVARNGAPDDFVVTDACWNEFLDFLAEDEIEFDAESLEEHRGDIELSIRRDMARHALGREEAYEIAIRADEQLSRTVDVLGKAEVLEDLFDLAESYSSKQVGMN